MAAGDEVLISRQEFYKVRPSTPFQFQVIVGEGQAGGTFATWVGGHAKFPGEDQAWHEAGVEGQNLSYTYFHCVTTVKDVREETNHTTVTINLQDGGAVERFSYGTDVQDGGVAIYSIRFLIMPSG